MGITGQTLMIALVFIFYAFYGNMYSLATMKGYLQQTSYCLFCKKQLCLIRLDQQLQIKEINTLHIICRSHSLRVCQGYYDSCLISAWEDWDGKHGSENDHPKEFPADQVCTLSADSRQLYLVNNLMPNTSVILWFVDFVNYGLSILSVYGLSISLWFFHLFCSLTKYVNFSQCYVVFVQEHGGRDLESFVLLDFDEARSLLVQVRSFSYTYLLPGCGSFYLLYQVVSICCRLLWRWPQQRLHMNLNTEICTGLVVILL